MENENHINAPPEQEAFKSAVISGRTTDEALAAHIAAQDSKSKWIEAACYVAFRTELSKGLSIIEYAEKLRGMKVESSNNQS